MGESVGVSVSVAGSACFSMDGGESAGVSIGVAVLWVLVNQQIHCVSMSVSESAGVSVEVGESIGVF